MFRRKNKLSCELKDEGRQLGMCDDIYNIWSGYESVDDLCQLYADNMEFIINHPNWRLNKTLKKCASNEIRHKHGIYIDEKATLKNVGDMIINGDSDIVLNVDNGSAVEIYVRENSKLDICLSNGSVAYINVYDNTSVNIKVEEQSKCFVYKYGGVVGNTTENVTIRDRMNK